MNWLMPVLLIIVGGLAVVAAWKNWDYYFESRKLRTYTWLLGRDQMRQVFGALGIIAILSGIVMLIGAITGWIDLR